jgi:hypothetical protein
VKWLAVGRPKSLHPITKQQSNDGHGAVTPESKRLKYTGDRHVSNTPVCILFLLIATAQDEVPDLTGTVAFNVGSRSGRVESLVVTIGDGGTGQYKAVLIGDSSLPTHAIYRPRDLRPFNKQNPLPIVAYGNGGCRNTSGEVRNFLSDIASQGFLILAIGPAANAAVMGSEDRTNMTASSQLLDGVNWAIAENSRAGSAYFNKIDVSKIAVMGKSCGAQQAIEVSGDPRITATVALNQGINLSRLKVGVRLQAVHQPIMPDRLGARLHPVMRDMLRMRLC